jgi:hypothetical protein
MRTERMGEHPIAGPEMTLQVGPRIWRAAGRNGIVYHYIAKEHEIDK